MKLIPLIPAARGRGYERTVTESHNPHWGSVARAFIELLEYVSKLAWFATSNYIHEILAHEKQISKIKTQVMTLQVSNNIPTRRCRSQQISGQW